MLSADFVAANQRSDRLPVKRPFHDQGQIFLYIGTIKSSQVKICDSTMHACILYISANIVQYTLGNINKLLDAFKITTSLQSKGNTFGSIILAFWNIL